MFMNIYGINMKGKKLIFVLVKWMKFYVVLIIIEILKWSFVYVSKMLILICIDSLSI